ncbi:hypothetical protein ATCC90586_004793 [Pythium insidiosum]|nr:hypothetical protein ATCC90586_004793 [Pythium insidiosum]
MRRGVGIRDNSAELSFVQSLDPDPIEELLSTLETSPEGNEDGAASASLASASAPIAAGERLTTRVRRRQELAYLRGQVQELEATVALLKGRASDPNGCEGGGGGGSPASVWQGIASRQQHAKRKAQIENAQLRELFEAQLRLLQSLERLLQKRPTILTSLVSTDESRASKRARLERATHVSSATSMFDILRLGLVTHLADIDSVFTGIPTPPVDTTDCQAKSDSDDNVFIELRQVKHFPFNLDATTRAVWQCLCAPHHDLDGSTYQAIPTDDDTCNMQLEMTLPLRRAHVSVQLDCVAQRRVETERTVIVCDSFGCVTSPLLLGQTIDLRETAYIVVEKTEREDHAVLRSCIRTWPDIHGDNNKTDGQQTPPMIGLLVDVIVGSFDKHVQMLYQIIETMLLDSTRQ